MVKQYPHKIIVSSPGTNSSQDTDGNWVAGSAGSTTELSCRAEPNGSGRYIVGADGKHLDYSFIVYLPKSTANINQEASVTIKDENNVQIGSGQVQRFYKGQLNYRLWV